MPNKIDFSVIIPCYNEEKNILLIVKRFYESKPKKFNCELVLVDNGSVDNTQAEIKKAMNNHSYVKLAIVKKNIGYGYGIMTGLKAAKGEYLSWTHADMQTDLADTIKAYELIKKQENPNKIFIRGNRLGRTLIDKIFTIGMAFFETILLGTWLWEINAQPKFFHRSLLKLADHPPNDWALDLYFYYVAKKNDYKIRSIDVRFPERIHGESKWNSGGIYPKLKYMKRTIDFSFELRRRLK